MKVLKTVVVKEVLTETSKQAMLEKFQAQIQQMDKECEQLRFELRRYEKERKYSQGMLRQKFEQEIERRQEKSKMLQYKIEQVEILPLGSELQEQELQSVCEVEVGDHWDQMMNESTIVIKDGKVAEIR